MAYLEPAAAKRRQGYTEVAIPSLTNANGSADGTIADVTAAFDQAILNNNFREVSDKINAILVELRKAGIINP